MCFVTRFEPQNDFDVKIIVQQNRTGGNKSVSGEVKCLHVIVHILMLIRNLVCNFELC